MGAPHGLHRPEPVPRPRSRHPVIVLLVLAAVLTVIGWAILGQLSSQGPTSRAVRPADVPPGTAVARVAPLPDGLNEDGLQRWAEQTAQPADVPARALRAYGAAELSVRRSDPGCRLSWATLAGIGRVESDHGRISGGEVRADGSLTEPIIGVALDGSGPVAAVPDSDGGRLDGDTEQDRAVGPMQFIPSTWVRWATDANGDGWRDPHNVDDAALAAGRYLCAGGRNMSAGSGWWDGMLTYNRSVRYGQQVYAVADGLARSGS